MDITGYVERLRGDLLAAAAAGGEQVVDAAERLAGSLDAAVRMALLEALSDAAAEITGALDGTTVEVRLRGREPDFVVTVDDVPRPVPPPDAAEAATDDDAAVARITLRLPEPLKQRAEAAAAAVRQSLNTWLVEAVRTAASDDEPSPRRAARRRGSQHLSGWAQ